jgi:hypothetical protein
MTKEKFAEKMRELQKVDHDLDFLAALARDDLVTLLALLRDRVDRMGKP